MLNALPMDDDGAIYQQAPPFNIEAERALLGALLLRNDLYDDIGRLQRHHFYDPLHAAVFDAICAIIRAGRRATSVEVAKLFERSENIDQSTTAFSYVLGLPKDTPGYAAKEYARAIVNTGIRRNLILIGEDIVAAARETTLDAEPQDLIEEAEERLFSLAELAQPDTGHIMDFGRAAQLAWEEIKAAKDGDSKALSTGLVDLDRKLGGLHPSNLVILAGRPAMGKTALATNIAHTIAGNGHFVDFYSLEMSGSELAKRIISARIRKASSDLRTGSLTPAMMSTAEAAVQSLQSLAMSIDQTGGISIATLTARARRNKRRRNTKLIVVDYLQLMQASKRNNGGNRVQDVAEITTGLKALAKELEVPVIALSQLSRNVEHRDNKRPQLSDLRESGSIEQDADIVLFVYRDEYYVERERPQEMSKYAEWQSRLQATVNKAEIIIGKQRHGETGSVEVAFNPSLTQFSNLARQEVSHDRA